MYAARPQIRGISFMFAIFGSPPPAPRGPARRLTRHALVPLVPARPRGDERGEAVEMHRLQARGAVDARLGPLLGPLDGVQCGLQQPEDLLVGKRVAGGRVVVAPPRRRAPASGRAGRARSGTGTAGARRPCGLAQPTWTRGPRGHARRVNPEPCTRGKCRRVGAEALYPYYGRLG